DAAYAVLPEEHALEHADRDEQARRAQLSHDGAAEALQVRLDTGLAKPGEHIATAGPASYRDFQRSPAVREAVGDRSPLARVQARIDQRADDVLRAGRAVPDLDRKIGSCQAIQYGSGGGHIVRHDRV